MILNKLIRYKSKKPMSLDKKLNILIYLTNVGLQQI